MKIKIATLENIDAITELVAEFRNYLNNTIPNKEEFRIGISKLINSNDAEFFIIVDENNSIQGYILQRYRFSMWVNGQEARIEDLFISSKHRKKGSGKALVEFAIARAKAQNCLTICLDTNENNQASTKIYKNLGFNSESKNWNNGRQIFFRNSLKS